MTEVRSVGSRSSRQTVTRDLKTNRATGNPSFFRISESRKRRRSCSRSHRHEDRSERRAEASDSVLRNLKKRRPNTPSKSDGPSSVIRPASAPSINSSEGTASAEEKIVSTYKDTLTGDEKELYFRVEKCVDTKMYQDGAWESDLISIWAEEAVKFQTEKQEMVTNLACPNATANVTRVKHVPLPKQVVTLERHQVRVRESLITVCKAHIKEWYKLEGLSPNELAKRVDYLLKEECFQSPEEHYDDDEGHPSHRFHAIQLQNLAVERHCANPQASGRKNPTLIKIYANGKAPCLYAATIHQCLKAWKDGSFNKNIKNTKIVMNDVLQRQIVTWNNLSQGYRDRVCEGLEQAMLKTMPEEKRPIQPRRELTDYAKID